MGCVVVSSYLVLTYAQNGKIAGSGEVGRRLMETLSRVPKFDGPKYEGMLNAAMQVCALLGMHDVS